MNNDHTYFVGLDGVLGHNAGCPIYLNDKRNFTRRGRTFHIEQGDEKSGWHHIYLRHYDSPLWKGGTKFPTGWSKEDILGALGKTIKHGNESKWYNLTIFEKKINFMGSGYRNFKATINIDGSVRTFHMMDK